MVAALGNYPWELAQAPLYVGMIMIIAVMVVSVLATVVGAAEFEGTVSVVDDKGMATIKATDGEEHKAQIAGVKIGDKVDCHVGGARRPAISSARHTNNTPGEAEQSAHDRQMLCGEHQATVLRVLLHQHREIVRVEL